MNPTAAWLDEGRLHLQHGPIDLVIGIDGEPADVAVVANAIEQRFATVLDELVPELAQLRADARTSPVVTTPIARRMMSAVRSAGDDHFVTAMAAVAGSVADEIADTGWSAAPLRRLHINNGGDIALRQLATETTVLGVVDDVVAARIVGRLHVTGDSGIGGVATSGWGGRSHSLGIADAVTVLARSAATADVFATLIANAIDLPDHPQVLRRCATTLRSDSDLGDRLVTCGVGTLTADEIDRALTKGKTYARTLVADGFIVGAVLSLQGQRRFVGPATLALAE